MDDVFVLNQNADSLDIKDAINERIIKAKAITSCLLGSNASEATLCYELLCNVVWVVDGLLDELSVLTELKNK